MIPAIRHQYNAQFSRQQYDAYIKALSQVYPGQLEFRLAETPVFVPAPFRNQMQAACESILDVVLSAAYKEKSEAAIPAHLRVPGDEGNPQFICFDFGVCTNSAGQLEPQLIEMQAFPTLFAWHLVVPEIMAQHFHMPEGFTPFFPGITQEKYIDLLRKIIVGDEDPEQVVLLELFPHQQKTRVDFYATRDLLGIGIVCLTGLIEEGDQLWYEKEGRRIPIRRIYNRVIFDELLQQAPEVQEKGKLFQKSWQVQWIPHPNWFYRISKFSLPFINHPHVPQTWFLNQVPELPADLENYVAKPLFSFAGQGVIIDLTQEALAEIQDPENWILQRKVAYAPCILTPDEGAKAEIRAFYFWEPGAERPIPVNNLARLSKGKMVGTRYNKDKEWVGGSYALFANEG
ncbi:hypothetical protein SAMN05444008_104313 [Cnuella takakiae]|uniref:Glutathionylspermidine synthase n=1 Tax=Cnuella takakiae TaxID=1302690 RepID=A0A1M4YKC6_9BACT|nr:hypothetical protein [Cnuella takakiae]OLY93176.1 hypothetical protein BUE76_15740 [Cnuella takakiae]SHF06113.1 hypothetical protein SAMN05444008_104313 [Cnuella takakiae]